MNNKIPCTMIRDIAPLYADDLIATETRRIIEEHVQECDDCREQYDILMKEIEHVEMNKKELQKTEIDGMKKINTYQKGNLILGVIISFLFGIFIPVIKAGVPIIMGNGITEYHLARLQVAWYIILFKMLASGVIVSFLYLGLNRILKRKK